MAMRSIRDVFARLPSDGKARHILRTFNITQSASGSASSVKELALALGIDVQRISMKKGMSGRLVQDPFSETGYCIEVNKHESVRSQRFAVLHEMGHFFLHLDRKDPFAEPMHLNRSNDEFYFDQKAETEANDFADVLLFGDGQLEATYSLHGGRIDQIAHRFGVTENMVQIALKKFGIRVR